MTDTDVHFHPIPGSVHGIDEGVMLFRCLRKVVLLIREFPGLHGFGGVLVQQMHGLCEHVLELVYVHWDHYMEVGNVWDHIPHMLKNRKVLGR